MVNHHQITIFLWLNPMLSISKSPAALQFRQELPLWDPHAQEIRCQGSIPGRNGAINGEKHGKISHRWRYQWENHRNIPHKWRYQWNIHGNIPHRWRDRWENCGVDQLNTKTDWEIWRTEVVIMAHIRLQYRIIYNYFFVSDYRWYVTMIFIFIYQTHHIGWYMDDMGGFQKRGYKKRSII